MNHTLVLLRHGESEWNALNLSTGWVDVALTGKGREEAANGGNLIKEHGLLPDVVHTSLLRRAISTANIALDVADRHWIPVRRDWRLNERHYGALQGKNKAETLKTFGEEQFMLWRRSYDVPPLAARRRRRVLPGRATALRRLGVDVPRTECLKDVVARFLPYWESEIVPDLQAGHTVLVDRARQQPACAGQAPRRHLRRRHRRAQHPHRAAAGLPARRLVRASRPRWRIPRPRGRGSRGGGRRQPGPLAESAQPHSPIASSRRNRTPP